jgi:hypothetical protein
LVSFCASSTGIYGLGSNRNDDKKDWNLNEKLTTSGFLPFFDELFDSYFSSFPAIKTAMTQP